jgi:hypothetical protein
MSESPEEHKDEPADDSEVEEQKRPVRREDGGAGEDSGEDSEVEEQRRPVR